MMKLNQQAIILMSHFHAFSSFVLGCGIMNNQTEEEDDGKLKLSHASIFFGGEVENFKFNFKNFRKIDQKFSRYPGDGLLGKFQGTDGL